MMSQIIIYSFFNAIHAEKHFLTVRILYKIPRITTLAPRKLLHLPLLQNQ